MDASLRMLKNIHNLPFIVLWCGKNEAFFHSQLIHLNLESFVLLTQAKSNNPFCVLLISFVSGKLQFDYNSKSILKT